MGIRQNKDSFEAKWCNVHKWLYGTDFCTKCIDDEVALLKEHKIISINKRSYPMQSEEHSELFVRVVVVLVAGEIGDYAAYIGVGDPGWVKRFGDKLSFEEAKLHFPVGLEEEKYRK